ncbi:beta-ketoacyl synthase chain length factor [Bacteroides sp. OttesenSCG-928-F21]|nr:beta-ketoacyl synthase chain length factor [Bacteroides sp. OttesenSCG-928-F21]
MIAPAYICRMYSIHPTEKEEGAAYLKAQEPDYKEIIRNPALRRRMSRIVKMGVACGLQCLGDTPASEVQAIITATGLGCLADTEKFMNSLIDNNEQLLNPTPFIQSTFNTIGAQIALISGNRAYNMTYVDRQFSFEAALLDALLRLTEGDSQVLAGAFDEITEASHYIQQRMGLYRKQIAGEGSQFFLLAKEKTTDALARIAPPQTFKADKESIDHHIEEYLRQQEVTPQEVVINRSFKESCGTYHTASAFGIWQSVNQLQADGNLRYILVHNQEGENHSLILVSQP